MPVGTRKKFYIGLFDSLHLSAPTFPSSSLYTKIVTKPIIGSATAISFDRTQSRVTAERNIYNKSKEHISAFSAPGRNRAVSITTGSLEVK